jgi:hypothetical protein
LDVTVPGPCFFKRDDLREWAEATGRRCDAPFLFPEDREAVQTESVASEPLKPRERTGTTRSDALDKAVKAARAALLKRRKREPTAKEVCVYLQDDPTGVVDDHDDGVLMWVDGNGKMHNTTHKSVANRLTRIRKQD